MHPRRSSSISFTLIEVLVVITIISVMAALLAPALKSAKESAWSVKCMSNLRQLHMAVSLYSEDYKFYPSAYNDNLPAQGIWWYTVRANIDPNISAMGRGCGTNLSPVLNCPAAAFKYCTGMKYGVGTGGGGISYDVHARIMRYMTPVGTVHALTPYPITDRPSDLILLADAGQDPFWENSDGDFDLLPSAWMANYDSTTANNPASLFTDADSSTGARTMRFRHNGKANAAFVDGHVAALKQSDVLERNVKVTYIDTGDPTW